MQQPLDQLVAALLGFLLGVIAVDLLLSHEGHHSMTWIYQRDEDAAAIEDLERQPDRGAALVAGAFLEERLLVALKARLHHLTQKLEGEMFKRSGPLATFAAKIDLGLLIGMYDPVMHANLHHIRKIRNEFAHKFVPITFKTQNVAAMCSNIKLPKSLEAYVRYELDGKQFTTPRFFVEHADDPRTRFMAGVKIGLLLITVEAISGQKCPTPFELKGLAFSTWR